MHGWGRQGCWLAHHTGCGKCTAWCSKHGFLTAKCGLACLYHIQKPAGYCPGSRQGSRLTQSTPGRREGSNHVSRGVHRAEKGSASQDNWNHSIYNWRGLSSDLDCPGLVTEWCDSGLPQQLAERAGWGSRSTTAPLWDLHRVALAGLQDTFFRCAVPRWIVLIPSFNHSVHGWAAEGSMPEGKAAFWQSHSDCLGCWDGGRCVTGT